MDTSFLDCVTRKVDFHGSNVDLLTQWIPNNGNKHLFESQGAEPFQLLCNLSTYIEKKLNRPIKIYELGTWFGMSALAFAHGFSHDKSKVITYDIQNCIPEEHRLHSVYASPQVECRIGLIQNSVETFSELLNADLIYIDVDPHDGIQEFEYFALLKSIGYKGLVVWDDIKLPQGYMNAKGPGMQYFWDTISRFESKCFDFTPIGHFTGTGLVIFS